MHAMYVCIAVVMRGCADRVQRKDAVAHQAGKNTNGDNRLKGSGKQAWRREEGTGGGVG